MKISRLLLLIGLVGVPSLGFAQKTVDNAAASISVLPLSTDVGVDLPSLPNDPLAPTSGTLQTQTAQSWTTAPWQITAGPGTYPDGGGVATWAAVNNTIVGTVAPASTTITLDTPVTLSGITYNSPFSMTLAGTATNNLGLDAGGATLNAQLTIANTVSLFQLANSISAPITGGGSAGLTKTGNGTVSLTTTVTGGNTYTGGTHINGGVLAVSTTAAIGDTIFGASGAGNGISFNGGSLLNNVTGGWTSNRDIFIDAGGATLDPVTAVTWNGIVSGSGPLALSGFSGVVTLTGANTFSGSVKTDSPSTLTLSGANGTLNQASAYDFAGIINLSNTTAGTNNNDRLSDTAAITSRGAAINITGNASAATNENAGALTLASGLTTITNTPNAAQPASLNFASITRQNNSTLLVRGTNLGAAPGNGVAQITSTASPGTLVGGGGAAGSTNISILPWAAGNISATATNSSSFVTWDNATGRFRPLNTTTEYSTLASGANTTDNTKVTAATAINAATTVNSVLVAGTGTLLTGTGGLNITSGALMYAPNSNTSGTVSANANFGTAEGIVTNGGTGTLTMSGILSGTGGLTLNNLTTGTIALTGANTYTGQTTLLGGQINYSGTVSNDGLTAGAFGLGTGALVANVGTNTLTWWATAASIINRDINITGNGPGLVDLGTSGTTYTVTVNGNVVINGATTRLSLDAGTSATAAMIMNGNITGTGILTDSNGSFNILSGNNSFSGGTNIQTGTYAAGSDTAFGTGTIYFSNTGKIQSKDSTAHTFSNDILLGANPTFQGTGALTFGGGLNLNGTRSIAVTNTTTFTGVVSNGDLTKTGAGTLALNSAIGNTYTGGTVLGTSAGTLNINNTSGSGTGTGTVSIGGTTTANRSTLSGNFIISGATSISGALNPGNSVGTANFSSSLTLTSNALVTMELGSASSADKVNVGGLLTLGGSTWNIVTIGGYQAAAGDTFDLVDWGSVSGTVTLNLAGAVLADPGNTSWDTSNFLTNGTITVVPEPSTFGLTIASAGLLLAISRRVRRS